MFTGSTVTLNVVHKYRSSVELHSDKALEWVLLLICFASKVSSLLFYIFLLSLEPYKSPFTALYQRTLLSHLATPVITHCICAFLTPSNTSCKACLESLYPLHPISTHLNSSARHSHSSHVQTTSEPFDPSITHLFSHTITVLFFYFKQILKCVT